MTSLFVRWLCLPSTHFWYQHPVWPLGRLLLPTFSVVTGRGKTVPNGQTDLVQSKGFLFMSFRSAQIPGKHRTLTKTSEEKKFSFAFTTKQEMSFLWLEAVLLLCLEIPTRRKAPRNTARFLVSRCTLEIYIIALHKPVYVGFLCHNSKCPDWS